MKMLTSIKTSVGRVINANDDNYERSRNFLVLEGITGAAQFSLTAGAFLTGYASFLGASDEINGIIAVLPALIGMVQIFSPLLFERVEQRKKLIIIFASIFRTLLSLLFFVPYLFYGNSSAYIVLAVIYILSFIPAQFNGPALSNWMIVLTPSKIRGRYFAHRDKISLGVLAVITLVLGKVLDQTKSSGHEFLGFAIVGIFVFIAGIFNIIALINMKEPEGAYISKKFSLKDILTIPLKNSSARKIILLFFLWNFSLQIGGPFINVYMVTRLKLDYTYIMGLSVVATIIRVIFATFWGRVADKKSWFLSTKASILVLALTQICWSFVTPGNSFILIPILHCTSGFAWAGINISLFNIQFLFAKKEGRTMYLGFNAAVGGIASIISATIGAWIVATYEGINVKVGFMNFTNLQIVFLVSGILLVMTTIYIAFCIERHKYDIEEE